MALTWDDLVIKAKPALAGGGFRIRGLAEGCTWKFDLVIRDKATGDLFDWTGITAEGFIYSKREGGTQIATWNLDLSAAGHIVGTVDAADTAGLVNPDAAHAIFLIKAGSPDQRIPVCLPANSPCPIRSEN